LAPRADSGVPQHHARPEAPSPADINRLIVMMQAGRYAEAENYARAMIDRHPNVGFAWKVLGVSLMMQGKDALPSLQKATELLPGDAETYGNLGNALQDHGRAADAAAAYRRAIQIKPDFADVHDHLGTALRDLGQLDEAVASFHRALQIRPNYAEAYGNLGNALLGLGRRDEALASYRRALQINPELAEAHNNSGNALRELSRRDEALASYRRALQIRPNYAEAHANLGNTLFDLGRLDEAAASYRRALEIKPAYPEAHANLGNALRDLGQAAEAAASYGRALGIQPGLTEVHNNLGNVLRELGRLDEAAASFRRALRIRPAFTEAHNNLGNALLELGQPTDAVASFRRALELDSELAEGHANLGNALLELGQLDEAAASFRRALEIDPSLTETHNNLGNALRDLGQLDAAAAGFRRALEIDPALPEAHGNLGNVLIELGQLDEAEASFKKALALKPDYAGAHTSLGIVLRLRSDTDAAEAGCRRALEIDPQSAATLAILGELHADRGQFAQAEDLFKQAISLDPDFPDAWAGIARCRKMAGSDAPWLATAQRIAGLPLRPRQEINLRYAIGKYFDDVRDFEQAFLSYQKANELSKRHRARYDAGRLGRIVDRIIGSFDRTWLERARVDGAPSGRPVLVVGMPRSGTTLVEQILASHPQVFGAGELTFWGAAAGVYESTLLEGAKAGTLSRLADDYLTLLKGLSADALRVVDKMPANFLYLGLIHAALPNARMIHVRRNPIDTCLSLYFQYFTTAYSYANDLNDLAHYYGEYLRIMEHWRSILPEGTILELPYEGLVDDQETWSRKMIGFIGLPWDPRCLDFHLTRRIVVTTSRWQVRQQISKTSVGRWRNYEKFVGPLRSLLELVQR
jgi:tetratricopeptide (TPR) repeat protein